MPATTTTWLITGSNRGIGLGIVKNLSSDPNNVIFAACRDPSKAEALSAVVPEAKAKLHIVKLDLGSEESINEAAKSVKGLLGDARLDFIINNAGLQTNHATALKIEPEPFLEDMKINVLGPALTSKIFLPLLERSSSSARPPIVMNMTSGLASIGLNFGDKNATYSIAKIGVNMLTYKQSAENQNIIFFCLDPGWVKTDMGGPNAMITVEESVGGILTVLRSVTPKDSGTFKHYTGKDLPW